MRFRMLSWILAIMIFNSGALSSASVAPPSTSDIAQVSNVVAQIGYLESKQEWNAIYDLVHPFSAQVIPRDALVGWYKDSYQSKHLENTTIISVTFLDSWRYEPNFRPIFEKAAEVSIRQEFKNAPDEYNVLHLAKYENLGWRWLVGDDKQSVADMVNTYSTDYRWGDHLVGRDLNQSWTPTFSPVVVRYQGPWKASEKGLSDTITRVRFDAGYESFRTEFFSIQTTLFADCLKLYEDDCIDRFDTLINSNEALMFDGFISFEHVAKYHAANHLFPRISLAVDEKGQTWFIQLYPLDVSANGVVIRADLHIGTEYYDAAPVDAMYLWATLDTYSWRT